MQYETTGYPLDCPTPLWEGLQEVQDTHRNINDELVVAIAEHVREADEELPDRIEDVVEGILGPQTQGSDPDKQGSKTEDEHERRR